MNKELTILAKKIRALSQNGLTYSLSEYDTERYSELLSISDRLAALATGNDIEVIAGCYSPQKEYVTPKVDIRAVIFNEKNEILLVREKADGLWSLPGGWADIGYSPSEVAVKEVKEETGFDVRPVRLLSVIDRDKHPHPPLPYYVYKFFILCDITGGGFTETFDITGKGFFGRNNLPPLSLDRILPEQIELMYQYLHHPEMQVHLD